MRVINVFWGGSGGGGGGGLMEARGVGLNLLFLVCIKMLSTHFPSL